MADLRSLPARIEGTVVYKALNEQGAVLYVGISDNFYARLGTHFRQAPWFNMAVKFDIETYPTRHKAMVREAYLIRTLSPRWNKAHRTPQSLREEAEEFNDRLRRCERWGCDEYVHQIGDELDRRFCRRCIGELNAKAKADKKRRGKRLVKSF